MGLLPDLVASLALGGFSATLLITHRLRRSAPVYSRVTQQGGTVFIGTDAMNAGYWFLQPAVRQCVRHGLSPALLSWLSLIPAALAGVAAAWGHFGIAAWSLLASALCDVLDGAVARAAQTNSAAGAVLDSVLDRYAEFFFFAGLLVYYRHVLAVQLLVMVALLGSFLITYSTAKAEALGLTPPRGAMKRSDRLTLLIIATGLAPMVHHWLEAPAERLAYPVLVAIAMIAVLANGSAIARFVALSRQAKS
jgi:phosphatidylglycerophosphate synthase